MCPEIRGRTITKSRSSLSLERKLPFMLYAGLGYTRDYVHGEKKKEKKVLHLS